MLFCEDAWCVYVNKINSLSFWVQFSFFNTHTHTAETHLNTKWYCVLVLVREREMETDVKIVVVEGLCSRI